MTQENTDHVVDRLRAALQAEPASARLQTAMAVGMRPHPDYLEALVERCRVEPDFFVRDMLTWALIQHDRALTLAQVLPELTSPLPQARAQALHTISKLKDPQAWSAITPQLLTDPEDEVARTAWRAASGLVPEDQAAALAELLATQFGRGDLTTQRSLSRSLVALEDAAVPVVEKAKAHPNSKVSTHALATELLRHDPDAGFDVAIAAAQRTMALRGAPLVEDLEE